MRAAIALPHRKALSLALAALLFAASAQAASAHQPRVVEGQARVTVEQPEVSKAYYGEFPGTPVTYEIVSDKPFDLYVSVLVPDLPGIAKDVSAEVRQDGRTPARLDASAATWEPFYEPFGGDNYFQGPEYRAQAPAGRYEVTVSRPGNRGKYVLAVGEQESFPPGEAARTFVEMPRVKAFMGKPFWTGYFNVMGLSLLVPVGVVAFAAALVVARLRRR